MRWMIAILLLTHGMAHLPGFLVNWQIWHTPELPYRTTAFGGTAEIGAAGTRFLGLMWLATGVLFAVLAVCLAIEPEAAVGTLLATAIGSSSLLCLAVLPESRWGLVVNAVLAASFIIQ
jgi:hypothetical protein